MVSTEITKEEALTLLTQQLQCGAAVRFYRVSAEKSGSVRNGGRTINLSYYRVVEYRLEAGKTGKPVMKLVGQKQEGIRSIDKAIRIAKEANSKLGLGLLSRCPLRVSDWSGEQIMSAALACMMAMHEEGDKAKGDGI